MNAIKAQFVYLTADIELTSDWTKRAKAPVAPSNYKDPEKIFAYEESKRSSMSSELLADVGELWDLKNIRVYIPSDSVYSQFFAYLYHCIDPIVILGEHAKGIIHHMLSQGFESFYDNCITPLLLEAKHSPKERIEDYRNGYYCLARRIRLKDPLIQFIPLSSLVMSDVAEKYMLPSVRDTGSELVIQELLRKQGLLFPGEGLKKVRL